MTTAQRRRSRSSALYHAEHNLWEFVPADVVPALQRLSTLGLKLVVVSNANGVLHRAFDRLGLTRYFHCICDSFVDGVEKPDPRFFQIALDRSGSAADSTMHVGDLYYVDVVGARASGLRAMLIDPFDLYKEYDADRVRTLDALVSRLGSLTCVRCACEMQQEKERRGERWQPPAAGRRPRQLGADVFSPLLPFSCCI